MERVTKVYFDPLLADRLEIEALVKSLPVGSAHAFKGELLLHAAQGVIEVVDISMRKVSLFIIISSYYLH